MSEEDKGSFKAWVGPAGFSTNGIKRVAEAIAILSLVVLALVGYQVYVHAEETKHAAEKQQANQEKIKDAIKEQTQATKLLTCVIYTGMTSEKKSEIAYEQRREICR